MPNDNTTVCGCGVVLDLPKSRNGMTAISTRNYTILIPKSLSTSTSSSLSLSSSTSASNKSNCGNKTEGRPQAAKKSSEGACTESSMRARGPNSRASDSGSTSSVAEQSSRRPKTNKKDKRLNPARRSRSAERAESHYTYIDSGSSIISVHRDNVAEALYCTIDGEDDEPTSNHRPANSNSQPPQQQPAANNAAAVRPPYAIPSMTSPPPTYDVAIAKSWQTGLPPSYEEYLFHKHALLTRSHTPPPPWTDTSNSTSLSGANSNANANANVSLEQISRELLASQPELREYLTQLALQGGAEQAAHHYHQLLLQQQALRKQAAARPAATAASSAAAAAAAQRSRAMPPRSQSESRAQQQQRIATMYEDGAWCMETTAIQSAFENGVAFCSLM